jgi:hypothetical protein
MLRQIVPFAQNDFQATADRIACNAGPVNAAADNQQIASQRLVYLQWASVKQKWTIISSGYFMRLTMHVCSFLSSAGRFFQLRQDNSFIQNKDRGNRHSEAPSQNRIDSQTAGAPADFRAAR